MSKADASIGASIGLQDGQFRISAIRPSSAAMRCDIQVNDVVVAIGDVSLVASTQVQSANDLLKGPAGSEILLRISRIQQDGSTLERDVRVIRELEFTGDGGHTGSMKESDMSFMSRIWFWWVNGLVAIGYRRAIHEEDLYALEESDKAYSANLRFEAFWKAEVETSKRVGRPAKLIRALYLSIKKEFLLAALLRLLTDIVAFTPPLFILGILQYLNSSPANPSNFTATDAHLLAAGLFVAGVFKAVFENWHYHLMFRAGMNLRSAMISLVYQKALRMTPKARQISTTGEIVNLMQIDTQKILDNAQFIHILWAGIVQIGGAVGLLIWQLGWPAVIGVLMLMFLIPANAVIMWPLTLYHC